MNTTEKTHPGFLKVKGRFNSDEESSSYTKKLASAVYACLANYGYCEMRCVGKDAVYNAVKSIIQTNGVCAQQGAEIMFNVSYDVGNIGELKENHVKDVTAIKFTVKDYTQTKLEEFKRETESDE